MIFNQSYYNAMDRGYYLPSGSEEGASSLPVDSPVIAPEMGVSIKNLGVSTPPFGDQLQALKSRIFQGASKVELGFMGKGKGSMQGGNTTPEMFGKDERMDIREIAKLNKIQLTTHASPTLGSLAGWAQQGFDEHQREISLHEIQRAIDFAADTTNGGAVVVHAQEYPRAVRESWDHEGFEAYPEEEQRAIRTLVDQRSGQMQQIRKNTVVYEPVYQDHPDDPKHYWLGVDGSRIEKNESDPQVLIKRTPIWQSETYDFKTARRDWKYFEDRANEWNEAHPEEKRLPEEMFFRIQMENQILRIKGQSLFYASQYEETKKVYDKVKEALSFYESLEKNMPEEEKWRLMQQKHYGELLPPESKMPTESLGENLRRYEQQLRYIHEGSAASDAQAQDIQENIENTIPIEKYADQKTTDTLVRAAMYAREREHKTSKEGVWGWDVRQGEKFEKPLFIAVENFFPDMQGGHPDEIKKMVIESRQELARRLESHAGLSRENAEKEASARIKATWDTSHANMWRKYFKATPGENMDQTDARFKRWYLGKAKEWRDEGIIGHIHLDDNFGWEDEHVTPGQGNAPIKEFMHLMKEKVEKGEISAIIEPAHQDYRATLGGWRLFGSSIYGAQGGHRDTWMEVERSYFGRGASPYFLVGESAPDRESWSLWSGQPME